MTLKNDPNFDKKKFTSYFKNNMNNLVSFNSRCGKSENLLFDGIFLSKVCNV